MSIADLRATLEWIKANPRNWDQSAWFCGTAACLGGHLVLRAGWQIAEQDNSIGGFLVVSPQGQVEEVDTVAARLAGITMNEGFTLWNSTNTLDQLEEHLSRLENDLAIYQTMSARKEAWQHCWTNRDEQVTVAAHRRSSYERIGGCMRRLDHDTRAAAIDYAETCARGMILTHHHRHGLLPAT